MAGTHTSLHYHLVWSPKGRVPLIHPGIMMPLYRYLHTVIDSRRGKLLAIGGTNNHVHLLLGAPRRLRTGHRRARPQEQLVAMVTRDARLLLVLVAARLRRLHCGWRRHGGRASVHPTAGGASQGGELRGRVYRRFLDENHITYDERYLFD